MKMQIKYNHLDFEKALNVAKLTETEADIMSIGSLLLYQKGILAVSIFKETFPDKPLYVDAKITDKAEDAIKLFSQAGASYVSILAGTHFGIIQRAVDTAKKYNIKIVLDFLNTDIFGQFAVESETLGVDAILLHRRINGNQSDLENDWQVIRGNSDLPIFMEGNIDEENIDQIVKLKPSYIVIGSAITNASDPARAANNLKTLINQ